MKKQKQLTSGFLKQWKTYFYALGTIPMLFSVSLLSFYFHAGIILGRLPVYNQPDPRELGIYNDYLPIISFTGCAWIYSLLAWLSLTVVYLITNRKQLVWKPIIISALAQVCAISLLFSGIMEWYGD